MTHSTRIERARGSMLGLAVGDALGAPLEGLSAQQVRQAYGQVSDYVDGIVAWRRKPHRWRLKGLYSDYTQQALVLAQCLLECGKIDAAWVARTYLSLATPKGSYLGAHRGVGSSFRQVLSALESGLPATSVGQDSAGCGAAMRIAPLALFHPDDTEALMHDLVAASLITHRDARSLAGAAAIALATRMFLVEQARDPSLLFHLAAQVARAEDWLLQHFGPVMTSASQHPHALSVAIAHVESLLDRPRDQAFAHLMEEGNRHGPEQDCRRPTVGFAPVCIPTCLYLFFTTDSFEDAIIEIVNLGGDADTAGAMLGAISGAFYGEQAIPGRWLSGLRNREGIALRAEALVQRDPKTLADLPSLIETERRLTREEITMRKDCMVQRQKGDDLGANRWWRS